jgi:hypothetical protein
MHGDSLLAFRRDSGNVESRIHGFQGVDHLLQSSWHWDVESRVQIAAPVVALGCIARITWTYVDPKSWAFHPLIDRDEKTGLAIVQSSHECFRGADVAIAAIVLDRHAHVW